MNNLLEISLSVNLSTIPPEVASRQQWIAWHYEPRNNNKPAKLPINPHTLQKASVNDPASWGSFGDAIFACDQQKCDGIGYVFSPNDPFVGAWDSHQHGWTWASLR
jgi:primase-polymerase (primpol)-like protein